MTLNLRSPAHGAIGLAMASAALAAPTLAPLHYSVSYEAGQIEQAYYWSDSKNVDREIINHATVWLLQEATLGEHAKAYFGVGGGYFFVYPRNLGLNPYSMSKRSAFGLTDAHGEFEFFARGEGDHGLLLKAGIFNYKFNPDAKDLGEYMYRTWTYPTVITGGGLTQVGSAGAQLSGLGAETKLGMFTNEVLLTVQTDRPPVLSLSVADMVGMKMGILDLGAGIMFDNFYNPVESQAAPKNPRNAYYTLVDGRKVSRREYLDRKDTVAIRDTSYYTMSGQKATARATLDFGKLIGSDMLSPQDLRLYFEAIVMGLKSYPTYYTKLMDRTAFMGGLNLPTFKLLDLLSVEVEYSQNPFANTTRGALGEGTAVPFVPDTPTDSLPNHKKISRDDIKWAVMARKEFVPGFTVTLQAANDHLKILDVYSTPDFYDFLVQPNHWYWVVNLSYSI